jgi:hypothetical protein
MPHSVSHEVLDAGLELRDQVLFEDINDQMGAFFTGAVYVAEQHAQALQDRVNQLEEALKGIIIDEGGDFAGDPSRWSCYRAAAGLAGKKLSQAEFNELVEKIRTEKTQ